ncbi:MAG: T9SS type A sorting domain-containing protein [Chitinophagaceae bacterium]|nr:T9SS type A sorting domain-containing protein [Chitinophagaceae bacterium]
MTWILLFTQANNYAVSLIYNPQVTDNYTLTLNAGKTLTVSDIGGYFNNNSIGSGAGFGTYTYNINGTLDLTASTQTTNQLTAFSPTGGTVNLNLNGPLKTGLAFNSSPVAPGVSNLVVANGVTLDATLATVMNFNGNAFTMAGGTAAIKRTIPNDGTKIKFPVGTASGSITPVSLSNATGAADVVSVSLKNTFTNPAPANTLPREWNIVETTGGGNSDTLRFEWTTAEEAGGFTGASPVFIGRWNGSAWDYTPASVSGTGSAADPYTAKGSAAFSQLGLFILSNTGTTPVSFINVKAYQKSNGIQVEFGNATETDILNYVIERSADGRSFNTAGTLSPKTNNGGLNSYTYFDGTVNSGNNFYRIKVTERNGSVKYSDILNVRLSGNSGVTVYPNPVKGHTVNVQLENLDKAIYVVTIFNEVGQTIYTKQLNHDGRTASFTVELPSTLRRGIYSLQVSNNSFRAIKNVVVE